MPKFTVRFHYSSTVDVEVFAANEKEAVLLARPDAIDKAENNLQEDGKPWAQELFEDGTRVPSF